MIGGATGWLDEVLRGIPQAFEAALERWRFLYRTARNQADEQHRIILDHSRPQDHENAKRLRQEAEAAAKAVPGVARTAVPPPLVTS